MTPVPEARVYDVINARNIVLPPNNVASADWASAVERETTHTPRAVSNDGADRTATLPPAISMAGDSESTWNWRVS